MAAEPKRSDRARALLLAASLVGLGVGPCPPPPKTFPCEDPTDCRLWEAASLTGVRFGFHDENGVGGPEGELAAAEGNAFTNHGVSWRAFQPAPDVTTGSMDAACAFSETHDLFQVAFHYTWEQLFLDDTPDWVLGITDPDELRDVLRERARLVFERCPGIDRISVANEPLIPLNGEALYENHFFRVLGPDYLAELFGILRDEAPPHVGLFLNDYDLIYFPGRAAAYVELVRQLVEGGVPIDAVGLQTHLFLVRPPFAREPDFALYRETMESIAALGLPVFVTELDVPVPPGLPNRLEVQAERYRKVVETCLAVPACDTLIVWGIDDAHTWLDHFDLLVGPGYDPLLFDASLQHKPAYFAVREALLRGRGGDHPVAGDELQVLRLGVDGVFLALRSDDPGVVAPTPASLNDPSRPGGEGGLVEILAPDGPIAALPLPPGPGWDVRDGETLFSVELPDGSRARLRLSEGEGLELRVKLRDGRMAPTDAAEGLRLRITLGTLRHCADFAAETVALITPSEVRALGAPKPPGWDCSDPLALP